MKLPDVWWTAPTESESGRTVMVTGRDQLDAIRAKGKHSNRVEIIWRYESEPDGMPCETDAALMGEATDALIEAFDADPVGILTGIYTGDGERDWVFYTMSLPIFGKVLNRALESLPTLPIVIEAYADPDWEEYENMKSISYIPPSDD